MPKTEDQIAIDTIVREILTTLKPYDKIIGLSALNYCMAALIHVRFDGAEGALRHSDEQTRYLLAELSRSSSTSYRTH